MCVHDYQMFSVSNTTACQLNNRWTSFSQSSGTIYTCLEVTTAFFQASTRCLRFCISVSKGFRKEHLPDSYYHIVYKKCLSEKFQSTKSDLKKSLYKYVKKPPKQLPELYEKQPKLSLTILRQLSTNHPKDPNRILPKKNPTSEKSVQKPYVVFLCNTVGENIHEFLFEQLMIYLPFLCLCKVKYLQTPRCCLKM